MTVTIDGKLTAANLMTELQDRVRALKERGTTPGLAVILVGDDSASAIYVRNKERRAADLGIYSEVIRLPDTISQTALIDEINRLNQTPTIDGILVQLPLPAHIDETAIINAINPDKDVDGFHPVNVGRLWTNQSGIVASTPFGIMQLLKAYDIDPEGKRAVIVGRSNIVGRPMAALLLNQHATVTIAHSRTKDLFELTKTADILVVATGQAKMITAAAVKPGAVVIDVGMDRDENNKLVGDVDFDAVAPIASAITPVPGGVGPMTIASLMIQTVALAEARANG